MARTGLERSRRSAAKLLEILPKRCHLVSEAKGPVCDLGPPLGQPGVGVKALGLRASFGSTRGMQIMAKVEVR